MMQCVVEFHGFRDCRNRWIVKELAIVEHLLTLNVVFQSPYSKDCITCRKTRKSVAWLERNYHKIQWEDGAVPFMYKSLRTMLKPFDTVYTKGLEKKEFLTRFHHDVRKIEGNIIDNVDSYSK